MRLNKTDLICGVTADVLRKAFRNCQGVLGAKSLAYSIKVPIQEAKRIIASLLAEGYIEPFSYQLHSGFVDDYVLTIKAGAIASAKFLPPISRAKADMIVAALRERAAYIEADPSLIFRAEYLYIFGSYAGTSSTLGDIDVACHLTWRPEFEALSSSERSDRMQDYSRLHGYNPPSFLEGLIYSSTHPKRMLRSVSRSISLHEIDDVAFWNCYNSGAVIEAYRSPDSSPFGRHVLDSGKVSHGDSIDNPFE